MEQRIKPISNIAKTTQAHTISELNEHCKSNEITLYSSVLSIVERIYQMTNKFRSSVNIYDHSIDISALNCIVTVAMTVSIIITNLIRHHMMTKEKKIKLIAHSPYSAKLLLIMAMKSCRRQISNIRLVRLIFIARVNCFISCSFHKKLNMSCNVFHLPKFRFRPA